MANNHSSRIQDIQQLLREFLAKKDGEITKLKEELGISRAEVARLEAKIRDAQVALRTSQCAASDTVSPDASLSRTQSQELDASKPLKRRRSYSDSDTSNSNNLEPDYYSETSVRPSLSATANTISKINGQSGDGISRVQTSPSLQEESCQDIRAHKGARTHDLMAGNASSKTIASGDAQSNGMLNMMDEREMGGGKDLLERDDFLSVISSSHNVLGPDVSSSSGSRHRISGTPGANISVTREPEWTSLTALRGGPSFSAFSLDTSLYSPALSSSGPPSGPSSKVHNGVFSVDNDQASLTNPQSVSLNTEGSSTGIGTPRNPPLSLLQPTYVDNLWKSERRAKAAHSGGLGQVTPTSSSNRTQEGFLQGPLTNNITPALRAPTRPPVLATTPVAGVTQVSSSGRPQPVRCILKPAPLSSFPTPSDVALSRKRSDMISAPIPSNISSIARVWSPTDLFAQGAKKPDDHHEKAQWQQNEDQSFMLFEILFDVSRVARATVSRHPSHQVHCRICRELIFEKELFDLNDDLRCAVNDHCRTHKDAVSSLRRMSFLEMRRLQGKVNEGRSEVSLTCPGYSLQGNCHSDLASAKR